MQQIMIITGLTGAFVANYALAKRLQRWRAVVARTQGVQVSLNVAPSTRTQSVVKNRLLSAAYAGAHRFGIQVFDPATSNTLMAALLVHDLRNPNSPAKPDVKLSNPMISVKIAVPALLLLLILLGKLIYGTTWFVVEAPQAQPTTAAITRVVPRETAPLIALCIALPQAPPPPRLRLMTSAGFAFAGTPLTVPPDAQITASAMSES